METISIKILNPKAKRLLKNLAELKLIAINPKSTFKGLLEKMRQDSDKIPTLDEIAAEVKQVRLSRNAKKS